MNKSPHTSLTKMCGSCGQQKPLTAFLYMSSTEGSTYGNICSSCRKAGKDKLKAPSLEDGSGTSTTGNKIDAKTKVKTDLDKKQQFASVEEAYHEEMDKKDQQQLMRETKTQAIAKNDKDRREGYLRRGFLDSKDKAAASAAAKQQEQQQRNEENAKTDIDYTKPVYIGVAGQAKHHSAAYRQLRAWLGNEHGGKGSAFASNVEKLGLADKEPPNPSRPKKK